MRKGIVLTGGCGYIGSHICYELMEMGKEMDIIIVDKLSNSTNESIEKIRDKFSNNNDKRCELYVYNIDMRNEEEMELIFRRHENIKYVIHLAGYKSVKKSNEDALEYYDNNLISTIVLLKVIKEKLRTNRNKEISDDKKSDEIEFIFSSSATVYGNPRENELPLREESRVGPINAYGRTKLMIEEILKDYAMNEKGMKLTILRYFNPIGAHVSGIIGENPNGIPENLVPYIMKVLSGELPILNVYGKDYKTEDGTCIRDYIHVVDLARAHIAIMDREKGERIETYNVGTGKGYSVREVIKQYEKMGLEVKYKYSERREGDSEKIYSDVSKIREEIEWEAEYDIYEMCRDAWNWWKNKKNIK